MEFVVGLSLCLLYVVVVVTVRFAVVLYSAYILYYVCTVHTVRCTVLRRYGTVYGVRLQS
jgi:hypothetical protein